MLIKDDCLNAMKALEENSIDSLITDPPAGISFMGKEWDKGNNFIPAMTEIFKETLRVLKPGAHGLVWALPRTSHWTATALEQAGFEIRDVITHLFGSGFPKSHNLGEGRGTALKPASEHWILVRRPISEKTVAANVLKHGTGGINIDECRISMNGGVKTSGGCKGSKDSLFNLTDNPQADKTQGRFPANLVLSHSENCEVSPHVFPDGDTMAICADDCPIRLLDEQSGNLGKSSGGNSTNIGKNISFQTDYSESDKKGKPCGFGDSGGASRFFYVAKASKKDRNEGCEELEEKSGTQRMNASTLRFEEGREPTPRAEQSKNQNHHPTVKATKLMEYLITLITPPNGTVLDPFMGSGSTGKAAKRLGFNFIGIEKEQEYFKIAEKRVGA